MDYVAFVTRQNNSTFISNLPKPCIIPFSKIRATTTNKYLRPIIHCHHQQLYLVLVSETATKNTQFKKRNQKGKSGIQLKGKNGILGKKGFVGSAKNQKRNLMNVNSP
jgi:hypothetical protein